MGNHKGIATLLLVILALVCLGGCGKKETDLSSCVTAEYAGYHSIGTARLSLISEEEFIGRYAEAFTLNKALKKYFKSEEGAFQLTSLMSSSASYNDLTPEELCAFFYRSVLKKAFNQGTLSKNKELSNGEQLTFSWEEEGGYPGGRNLRQAIDLFDFNASCPDIWFTVSGLKTVPTFDPFDRLKLSYENFSPNATLVLSAKAALIEGEGYSADITTGLKNGDKVTVTYTLPISAEECAKRYDKLPSRWQAEITITGVPELITSADQIDASVLSAINDAGRDMYRRWSWQCTSCDEVVTYLGCYLLAPVDESIENNIIIPVYRVTYTAYFTEPSGWRRSFEPGDLYWCCALEGVSVKGDGKVQYASGTAAEYTFKVKTEILAKENKNAGTKSYYSFSCYAYESLENLYKTEVTPRVGTDFTAVDLLTKE